MRRFFLIFSILVVLTSNAIGQNVTQYFSGTANVRLGNYYGPVQGTLGVSPSFTLIGTNGSCEAAYFNVGGEYSYSGTASMTIAGPEISATKSGAMTYTACDNSREVSFSDGTFFAVECWPYAPYPNNNPTLPLSVPTNRGGSVCLNRFR